MIAFDAVSNYTTDTQDENHTCSGSNRILFVGIQGDFTDTLSAVTYNGVAMTLVNKKVIPSDRWIYLMMLVNPASGSNVIHVTGPSFYTIAAVSYTGALQTDQPDANNTNSGSSITSLTTNVTTVVNNCWLVGMTSSNNGGFSTAGANTTRRGTNSGGLVAHDSNAVQTPPGSFGQTITAASAQQAAMCIASFKPAAEITGANFFLLMQ